MNLTNRHADISRRVATLSLILSLTWFLPAPDVQAGEPKLRPGRDAAGASAGGGVPRLVLSATNWDFGQKWVGEPIPTTDIVMKNQGGASLTIEDVVTSCGCAAVAPKSGGSWKGKLLAPGASETMTIAFNTAREVREVARIITVLSSDPVQPRMLINLKGKVLNPFVGKPEDCITFGRLRSDANETREIELVNATGDPMRLKLQPPDQEAPFDLKLTEIEPGKVYRLSARTRPPLKAGATAVEVLLETGLRSHPLQNVPVSVFVPAPVFVSPGKLYADATQPLQRLLRLSYQLNSPVTLKEVTSTHPDLIKAELLPPRQRMDSTTVQEFGDHTIRVSLPPGAKLPMLGAAIEIVTDHPAPAYQRFVVPLEPLRTKPGSQSSATSARSPKAN